MSALLYIGGVLYLLAVIRTTGKRWDADFHAWQTRMHDVTVARALRSDDNGETQIRSKAT